MTPKEKSQQLFDTMLNIKEKRNYSTQCMTEKMAKDAALICVDEILQSHYVVAVGIKSSIYNFWEQVKIEIENYEYTIE
jgi:hypothetical protein